MTGMATSDEVRRRIEEARVLGLDELDLRNMGIAEIPNEVFQLKKRRHLLLADNRLRSIPNAIRNLPYLELLWLFSNPLEELPDIPGLCIDADVYLDLQGALSLSHIRGLAIDPVRDASIL